MFVEHDRCNMKTSLDCDNKKLEKNTNFIQESYPVTIDGRVILLSSEAGASGSSQSLN